MAVVKPLIRPTKEPVGKEEIIYLEQQVLDKASCGKTTLFMEIVIIELIKCFSS